MRCAFALLLAWFGLLGRPSPVGGIDTQDRPIQQNWLTSRTAQALRAQCATLGGRRRFGTTSATGRIAAWIAWVSSVCIAVLAVVDVIEAGAVTGGQVQRTVGAKGDRVVTVAWELLAPGIDHHFLAASHHRVIASRGIGGQPREAPADDTAIGRRSGRRRAGVVPRRRSAADGRIEGIVDVKI